MRLLNDKEWGQWPNTKIADRCSVAESFVRKIKEEMGLSSHNAKIVTRGGTTYTQNTTNIGKRKENLTVDPKEHPTRKLEPEVFEAVKKTDIVDEQPEELSRLAALPTEEQKALVDVEENPEIAPAILAGEMKVTEGRRQLRRKSMAQECQYTQDRLRQWKSGPALDAWLDKIARYR